ncbi:MAG: amidophosphoribosyltransferase [Planctomycetota bacterium]
MSREALHLPVLPDQPREKCGVLGIWGEPQGAHLAYMGLFALQHRGQESAGIAATDGTRIERSTGMGLVAQVFDEKCLGDFDALVATRPGQAAGIIAHNRYSTTGASRSENAQPFLGHYRGGQVAIGHNGNIVNAKALRQRLEDDGHAFYTSSDTEVVLSLLAAHSHNGQSDPLGAALSQLQGAFSLVLLFRDRIEVARDPHGWRPLVLGRTADGHPVAASETVALDVIGAEFIREVEPGEIVTLDDTGLHSRRFAPAAMPAAHCVFEHVYFASPASTLFGLNVQTVRERLGATLAQESPVEADLVVPMPDSGRSAATGFSRSAGIPYREAIIPNRYVGRTFIKPTGSERAAAVRLKLNVIADIVAGQRVVIVDDSIVRGTTTRLKMDQLRAAGAREIHLRISCPPIRHPCFFGVDFPDREQLIAHARNPDEIGALLGVDSLAFLSLEGLLDVVSQGPVAPESYCTACYSGKYPISVDGSAQKHALQPR